jgi:hypothetical protein
MSKALRPLSPRAETLPIRLALLIANGTLPLWRDHAITIAVGIPLLRIGVAFALRMASVIARGARDYTIDSAPT